MILNRLPTESEDFDIADVVIVGAGTVGLYLAVALERAGLRVSVLESGGPSISPENQQANKVSFVGRRHEGSEIGRGRGLGGTSNLWGGQLVPFPPYQFSKNFRAAGKGLPAGYGWPIGYDEISPWYTAAAVELGLGASFAADQEKIWSKSVFGAVPTDGTLTITYTRWLKEPNIARYYSDVLERSPNLRVFLNATTVGFVSGPDGQILGVVVREAGGCKERVALGKIIVLANGTLEISRLLLHSATCDSTLPWRGNDNVGRFFQDHLDINIGRLVIESRRRFSDAFDIVRMNGIKHQPKIVSAIADGASGSEIDIAGAVVTKTSVGEYIQDLKLLLLTLKSGAATKRDLIGGISGTFRLLRVLVPVMARYIQAKRISSVPNADVLLRAHCEQPPNSSSKISLSNSSVDQYGVPKVEMHWQFNELDQVSALRAFGRRADNYLRAHEIGRLELDPALATCDPMFIEHCRDSYHHCGGAVMGKDQSCSVTGSDLRVHGTKNLYVLGAALFPSSGFANPTFTAFALGSRLAQDIQRKLQ